MAGRRRMTAMRDGVKGLILVQLFATLLIASAETAQTAPEFSDAAFTAFTQSLVRAQRLLDWKKMRLLAQHPKADFYVAKYFSMAEASAAPRRRGFQPPWDPAANLGSEDLVNLGLHVMAAKQGVTEPRSVKLSEEQADRVRRVWLALYSTSLTLTGATDDPPPSAHAEIRDKTMWAANIAMSINDYGRAILAMLGSAWYLERIGETARARDVRRMFQTNVENFTWPPVRKGPNGYRLALPAPPSGQHK